MNYFQQNCVTTVFLPYLNNLRFFIFKLSGFRLVLLWFSQGFNVLGFCFAFVSSCPLDILVDSYLLLVMFQSLSCFLQLSPQPKYDETLILCVIPAA